MKVPTIDILLVEDDNSHAELIQQGLGGGGEMTVFRAPTGAHALTLLDERVFHLVLLDYSLPDHDGLEILRDIRRRSADLPVIFLTSADSAEICVRAMKGGANDYVLKKRNYLDSLVKSISSTCPRPHRAGGAADAGAQIVGLSGAMAKLRTAVARAAACSATVLIEGETGTGKDVVACAIHAASERARRAYVPVNCAEIPENLFESELFGHARGAFTGAVADRKGLLESANHGTLMLDEIEALAGGHQAKLLRVLQAREFKPVGSTRYTSLDVRVIAASNQDLERLVGQERFRRDLYYRLDVLRIHIPPLRARREDVAPLAEHFIDRFNRRNKTRFGALSAQAVAGLAHRAWPGNVRELENLIERTLVNSSGGEIDESEFEVSRATPAGDAERTQILAALARNRWNREQTAHDLGLSRVTLWRKMGKYDLRS